ncbi:MAG: hypothetical protein ABIR47_08805 [Candidatus Kapaibacterium sp.]
MALLQLLRATSHRNHHSMATATHYRGRGSYFSSFPRWYLLGRRDGAAVGFALGFVMTCVVVLAVIRLAFPN